MSESHKEYSDVTATGTTSTALVLDLQELLQDTTSGTPEVVADMSTYGKVQPHMTYKQFMNLFPAETPRLSGWKACTQCSKSWRALSTLATLTGEPVYLGEPLDKYPKLAQAAVQAYQHSFRMSPMTNQVVQYVSSADNHCHNTPNLGYLCRGCSPSGRKYTHCYLVTKLDLANAELMAKVDLVNRLCRQELPDLERYLREWSPEVVQRLLDWYTKKGEKVPGYRVNVGGLRFMNNLQSELELLANERHKRGVVIKHLLNLFKGDHPCDAQGAIHVFANCSNMSACRYSSTPEIFWNIMDQRYNPVTYRQPITTPTVNQVKATLKLLDNDLSCFDRVHLTVNDPEVVSHTLFVESPQVFTSMTAEQLLQQVHSKHSNQRHRSMHKSTCFDIDRNKFRSLNVDSFEQWLRGLPAGSKLEYMVTDTVVPIQMGRPTTPKGLEMVKTPVGWAITSCSVLPRTIGLSSGWKTVKQVTYHPGRWQHGGGLSTREQSLNDGYVLQMQHSWDPGCSCLFAEFFRGEYHALGKTRQELHRSLRIKYPELIDAEVFQGLFLSVKLLCSTWQLMSEAKFRATLPDGTVTQVTAE